MGKICLAKSRATSEREENLFDPEHIEGNPLEVGLIIRRTPQFKIATNISRVLIQHSPTGFEVGYSGSGVADFALNTLHAFLPPTGEDFTITYNGAKCSRLAYRLHQQFKDDFLASQKIHNLLNEGKTFKLSATVIKKWIEKERNK